MKINFTKTLIAAVAAFAAAFGVANADHHGKAKKDIVDTAVAAGDFTTLAAALEAAGLVETLKGEGPFTVFAPTDAAFAKLPEGAVENLLKPENKDQLIAVLTYHVLPGKVMSGDIAGKTLDVETVQGSTISVDATDGVKVDDASVTKADIKASNGVIHVIDAVVMP
ncbi:fasciclin domain-containing protein [Hyphococcus sp.]|uniref:fasciclin domain-containing protein n=1 Tax=Hyphococcus sp. TaxID=2038636 RepID=UPI0035C72F94